MMNDEPFGQSELRQRIRGLSDQELLQIVQADPDDSPKDVIDTARREIAYRRVAANLERADTVRWETFRGRLTTWDELFGQAASFATQVGRERVISISHSEDENEGVVTVWYWG